MTFKLMSTLMMLKGARKRRRRETHLTNADGQTNSIMGEFKTDAFFQAIAFYLSFSHISSLLLSMTHKLIWTYLALALTSQSLSTYRVRKA